MKTQFIRAMIMLAILLVIILLVSCSLDTPPAPPSDNPWDPDNPAPPRAPVGLTGRVITETSLRLDWQDQSGNESGFVIEEGSGDLRQDSLWVVIDTVNANILYHYLSNRQPATEYRYRIYAFNAAGNSPPNDTVLILNTGHIAPTSPDSLKALDRDGISVKLEWKDRSANEDRFEVLMKGSVYDRFQPVDSVAANITECVVDSLDFTHGYYYFKIRVVNSYGESTSQLDVDYHPGFTPLTMPYNVTAVAVSENEVEVSWSDSNHTAEQFRILMSVNDTLSFGWVRTFDSDIRSWLATELRANTIYHFKVHSTNRWFVNSPLSAIASASTAETSPWPPSDVTASIENELDVRLRWQDKSGIEWGYLLQEIVGDIANTMTIDTLPPSTTDYIHPDCERFVERWYRICAIGQFGNSTWSFSPMVTPGSIPPNEPSDFTAVALSPTEIELSWRDNSRIEDRFDLLERPFGGSWTQVATVPENSSGTILGNRRENTNYTYRIVAANRYGTSDWIQSPAVTTPGRPQAPTNLEAEGTHPSSIRISWVIDGDRHDGFILEDSLDGSETWALIDSIKSPEVREFVYEDSPRYIRNYFRIKSFNEHGSTDPSNIDAAMPYATVAFVACNDAGVVAVDVTDPANPVEISRLDTPGLAQKVDEEANVLYLADSYGGFSCISVKSPAQLRLIGTAATDGRANNLEVEGGYAYVSLADSGIAVFRVSSRSETPTPLGRFRTFPGQAQGLSIVNTTLYAASGDRGILKLDVSTRSAPALLTEVVSPSSAFDVAVDVRGGNLVTAEYAAGARVLQLANLAEVEVLEVGGQSFGIVQGETGNLSYFYIANYSQGLSVIQIAPPSNSTLITTLRMPDNTWGIDIFGNYAFMAVDNAGLKVVDISAPNSPSIIGTFQTPGPARGVVVREYR